MFNHEGYLTDQIVEYSSLIAFEHDFVDSFFASNSRRKIYDDFIAFLDKFCNICTPRRLWIDGSYVTDKLDPQDIDVVIFIDYSSFRNKWRQIKELLVKSDGGTLDIFPITEDNEDAVELLTSEDHVRLIENIKNWESLFSKDRAGKYKGFVQINSVQY